MLSYDEMIEKYGNTSPANETVGPSTDNPIYQQYIESQTESSSAFVLDIFLSTALAIFLYCGIPFLVAKFSKKPWSTKKRRIFIVCNAVISYFIIALIKYALNPVNASAPNMSATVFWSFVASYIFKCYHPESKKLSDNPKKNPDPYAKQVEEMKAAKAAKQNNDIMENQISLDDIVSPSTPAPTVTSSEKPKEHSNLPLIVCVVLLVCSLAGNAYLYNQNSELSHEAQLWGNKYSEKLNDLDNLQNKYNAIYDEYSFYHNGAVIVTESGSRYHTYDCYHWDYPIWIYNTENAKYKGYTPCKDCNPPQ